MIHFHPRANELLEWRDRILHDGKKTGPTMAAAYKAQAKYNSDIEAFELQEGEHEGAQSPRMEVPVH